MKLQPIITSLLETDLYKFSMGMTIYHQFPSYRTTWTFKCRNKDVHFTKEMVEEIRDQIREMVREERLSEEQRDCVRVKDIVWFTVSHLGQRMKKAALEGRLLREQPFMIARKASELDPSWKADTSVLVQGIIDAYFLEDEEIVLVDYKTDRVSKGEEQRLVDLYHVQLEDYACALTRLTGRRVKETFIYSFALGKAIRMDVTGSAIRTDSDS